jgi:Fe2+ transport system protein B
VVLAAIIVLIPGAPLGTMTQYVQVLAGVLLPSAILFLLLLCNDKGVLGPWCNKLWQNVVTTFIIGVLVVLSLVLVVNTLFKSVDVPTLTYVLFGAYAAVLLVGALVGLVVRQRRLAAGLSADPLLDVRRLDRNTWRMPRLEQLAAPVQSRFRKFCLYTLRAYLVVSVILITIKIAQSVWG